VLVVNSEPSGQDVLAVVLSLDSRAAVAAYFLSRSCRHQARGWLL